MTFAFFTFTAVPGGFEPQASDQQTVINALRRIGHAGFVFEVGEQSLKLEHKQQPEWREHIACGSQFICPVSSTRDVDIDPRHREYWRQLSGSSSPSFVGMLAGPSGLDFDVKPGCYVIVAAGSSLHVGPASLFGLKIKRSENEQEQEFRRTESANPRKKAGRGKRV